MRGDTNIRACPCSLSLLCYDVELLLLTAVRRTGRSMVSCCRHRPFQERRLAVQYPIDETIPDSQELRSQTKSQELLILGIFAQTFCTAPRLCETCNGSSTVTIRVAANHACPVDFTQ